MRAMAIAGRAVEVAGRGARCGGESSRTAAADEAQHNSTHFSTLTLSLTDSAGITALLYFAYAPASREI